MKVSHEKLWRREIPEMHLPPPCFLWIYSSFVLRQGFMQPRLTLNLLYNWSWPWILDLSASASQVLENRGSNGKVPWPASSAAHELLTQNLRARALYSLWLGKPSRQSHYSLKFDFGKWKVISSIVIFQKVYIWFFWELGREIVN